MKNVFFCFCGSFLLLIAATQAQPAAAGKSVRNFVHLISTLNALEDIAMNGASIEFFGWRESFEPLRNAECQSVNAQSVVNDLRGIVVRITTDSDNTELPISPETYQEFASLLGNGKYEKCEVFQCGNGSCTEFLSYTAQNGLYAIRFEIGTED